MADQPATSAAQVHNLNESVPRDWTEQEAADLNEIARLLDEAYTHYFATSDGYCKSSEGYVSVSFGNFFDRRQGIRKRHVEVYSYVLGPSRMHDFDSIEEALETVREWHAECMNRFCHECEGTTEHEDWCFVGKPMSV